MMTSLTFDFPTQTRNDENDPCQADRPGNKYNRAQLHPGQTAKMAQRVLISPVLIYVELRYYCFVLITGDCGCGRLPVTPGLVGLVQVSELLSTVLISWNR